MITVAYRGEVLKRKTDLNGKKPSSCKESIQSQKTKGREERGGNVLCLSSRRIRDSGSVSYQKRAQKKKGGVNGKGRNTGRDPDEKKSSQQSEG